MNLKINKCTFDEIREKAENYYIDNDILIDSFLEDHILASTHYKISIDDKFGAFFSIFKKQLLSQFFVEEEFRHKSQDLFFQIIKYEEVKEAFVSTSNEFLLSHCLEHYTKMEKQGYFSKDAKRFVDDKLDLSLTFVKASFDDIDEILEDSGEFFDDIKARIKRDEIYIAKKDGENVAYGIFELGRIAKQYASVGMFVLENQRGKGYGRTIISYMKKLVNSMGRKAISGCWAYNHNSKKTVASAGMYSQTILLKIYF